MTRILKTGSGWRFGWDPEAIEFRGLIGADDWSIELTQAELDDFCRLVGQLAETMQSMQAALMAEEALTLEAESEWLWLEAEGMPSAYGLRVILLTGRRAEGAWLVAAVPGLLGAVRSMQGG
ncbi:MAG: hypothetical protein RLZZ511_2382 [Cyanobacteriota bacterium]|jgi:Domain of unknown function (DUF1818)